MSKKPSYYELLRHPNWQRKRLEILERANFQCEKCQAADVTLNVHHGYYAKGLKPWEYENDTLWCLCEKCHQDVQETLADIHRLMAHLTFSELLNVCDYVNSGAPDEYENPWADMDRSKSAS